MSANAYKDFIKPFTGEGDVVSFITKVEWGIWEAGPPDGSGIVKP